MKTANETLDAITDHLDAMARLIVASSEPDNTGAHVFTYGGHGYRVETEPGALGGTRDWLVIDGYRVAIVDTYEPISA